MASSGDGHRLAASKRERGTVPTESRLPQTHGTLRRPRTRQVPQLRERFGSTKHYFAARPRHGLALKRPQLLLQQFSVFLSHHCPVGPREHRALCIIVCPADESESDRETTFAKNRHGTSGKGRANARMQSRCSADSPMNSKPCTKPARWRTTARKISGCGASGIEISRETTSPETSAVEVTPPNPASAISWHRP